MKMRKMNTTKKMVESGALAIVRADVERACEIADGLIKGGVPVMEMSYTFNTAGDVIKALKEKYGEALTVGAGTVLDSETARHAILNGAEFIIAPNYDEGVAKMCNRYQIPYAPGCTSLTEAVNGLTAGAAFIKAFPISNYYGPNLAKVFKVPCPQIPVLASGGITPENVKEWVGNGAEALGVGGLLTKGSAEDIAKNAKMLRDEFVKAKEAK